MHILVIIGILARQTVSGISFCMGCPVTGRENKEHCLTPMVFFKMWILPVDFYTSMYAHTIMSWSHCITHTSELSN